MTIRDGLPTRCLAVTLLALTVALSVTAVAEAWRRPSAYAVSSPDGGQFRVCRDGITFQVANTSPGTFRFRVYSPPAIFDPITGEVVGTVVAAGEITTEPIAPPLPAGLDPSESNLGTTTIRWADGRLLVPGADLVQLATSPPGELGFQFSEPYDVEDCVLFRPTSKDQCKKGGWQTFGIFRNQGDCVSFVATGGKNPPAGP